MSATQMFLFAALLVGATSCIITANVVFYQIMTEVNSTRTLKDRYTVILVSLRAPEILREHAHLFPESAKRKRMFTWSGVGFALLVMISFVL